MYFVVFCVVDVAGSKVSDLYATWYPAIIHKLRMKNKTAATILNTGPNLKEPIMNPKLKPNTSTNKPASRINAKLAILHLYDII